MSKLEDWREQRKARTRKAVLKAARVRFAQIGVDDTTMDDIAARAQVARATVFNHFPTKAAIVAELAEQMDDAFIAIIDRYAKAPISIRQRIVSLYEEIAQAMEARRHYYRHLVGHWERARGEASETARVERLNEAFVRMLTGEGCGGLREDVDAPFAAEMLLSIQIEFIHKWRTSDNYPLMHRLPRAARLLAEALTLPDALDFDGIERATRIASDRQRY